MMDPPGACGRSRTPRPALIDRAASQGTVAAVALAVAAVVASGRPATAADGPAVMIERSAAGALTGTLLGIERDGVRVAVDGEVQLVPVGDIRRLVRTGGVAEPAAAVGVGLVDGATLTVDAFTWEAATATLRCGEERGTLPVERVRWLSWPAAAEPAWLDLLPQPLDSDVVVVTGEALQCVACAVTGVMDDAVTVMLDGETIPVRRGKVAGVHWLRPEQPRGPITVRLRVGTLTARVVEWSSAELLLDDTMRLPADWLQAVDYAAGRTLELTTLDPERTEVEPFFGGLVEIEDLAPFFRPRSVVADATAGVPGGLVIRPRTRVVWRLPPTARRFRASVMPQPSSARESTAAAGVVIVAVDGREQFREAVASPAAVRPIDVDVAGGRRLEIRVDFPEAGGMGGPVLVTTPVIEQ